MTTQTIAYPHSLRERALAAAHSSATDAERRDRLNRDAVAGLSLHFRGWLSNTGCTLRYAPAPVLMPLYDEHGDVTGLQTTIDLIILQWHKRSHGPEYAPWFVCPDHDEDGDAHVEVYSLISLGQALRAHADCAR